MKQRERENAEKRDDFNYQQKNPSAAPLLMPSAAGAATATLSLCCTALLSLAVAAAGVGVQEEKSVHANPT